MQVQVGAYFADDARGAQREVQITLTEEDVKPLYGEVWDSLNLTQKVNQMTGTADIYMLRYAASRGFRAVEIVDEEIRTTKARMQS